MENNGVIKIIKNKNNELFKVANSKKYNSIFNLQNGKFLRWGETKEDDPSWSPFGPEILDIEITTKCSGVGGKLCSYCYKSNTPTGKNMSFEMFKTIIDKVNTNRQLTQIAFGLGSTGIENPDIWKMCEYVRENHIIPNGTVSDITDETADNIAKYFGACAISIHKKEEGYNSVKKLTDRGMTQVNIHQVIHSGNIDEVKKLIDDSENDERLNGLNAIVFLSLKKVGRAKDSFQTLTQNQFDDLMDYAVSKKIKFGFDSCSAKKFENYCIRKNMKDQLVYCEPCESTLFSLYVDVEGKIHACSFCEKNENLKSIQITEETDFNKVWIFSEELNYFRKILLTNKRACPIYEV